MQDNIRTTVDKSAPPPSQDTRFHCRLLKNAKTCSNKERTNGAIFFGLRVYKKCGNGHQA
jgi:hypothetical protein